MKTLMFALFVGCCVVVSGHGGLAWAQDEKPTEASAAIEKAVNSYVDAFNKKDPAALAAHWTPNCLHCVNETGERTEGREAIQTDFAALFEEKPNAALGVKIDDVRMISDDVASAEGVARVAVGSEISDTSFTAIFKLSDGKWLIDSVHESTLPPPPTSGDYLRQLEWMIGSWMDDTEGVRVETSVRWSDNGSFLIRSYTAHREGQLQQQGTQVIGWDPKQKIIRSWMFDADGSFGEGTWSQTDKGWAIKGSITRADGSQVTGVQELSMEDENTLVAKRTSVVIDGEAQPDSEPVKMIRILTQD